MTEGLDQAAKLKPGQGSVAANLQVASDRPLALVVEGMARLDQNWAVYGDAWVQPTEGRVGGDVGARFQNNLDIYAGGWADRDGRYAGEVGVRHRW